MKMCQHIPKKKEKRKKSQIGKEIGHAPLVIEEDVVQIQEINVGVDLDLVADHVIVAQEEDLVTDMTEERGNISCYYGNNRFTIIIICLVSYRSRSKSRERERNNDSFREREETKPKSRRRK